MPPFFGLDHNTLSRSRFFVFHAILSGFPFAEALATCDLLLDSLRSNPSTFSPLFFSHGNSNLSDRRVDLSQSSFLSPTSHSCAALYRYIRPALSLPFFRALSPCPPFFFSFSLPPMTPSPVYNLLRNIFSIIFLRLVWNTLSHSPSPARPHSGILRLRSSPLNFSRPLPLLTYSIWYLPAGRSVTPVGLPDSVGGVYLVLQ